jgi:hypothetical protein
MRQVIIRSLATAGVVGGLLLTGVGVAVAQEKGPIPDLLGPTSGSPVPTVNVLPQGTLQLQSIGST